MGGPHKVLTKIHKEMGANYMSMSAYISERVHDNCNGYKSSLDFSLLHIKEQASHFSNDEIKFDEMEKFSMKENIFVDELMSLNVSQKMWFWLKNRLIYKTLKRSKQLGRGFRTDAYGAEDVKSVKIVGMLRALAYRKKWNRKLFIV